VENRGKVLIACSMLEDEIRHSLCANGIDMPVVWADRGLHECPDKLRAEIQGKINEHARCQDVLLAFCQCGNGTVGLRSGTSRLVIPKFDDCIRMLLSNTAGAPPQVDVGCLYYTKGWMSCDSSILKQLQSYYERYGEKKARQIIGLMYKNYHGVRLIDTGAYNVGDYMGSARQAADILKMNAGVCRGTTRVIDKLLRGEWDDEFCVIPPGQITSLESFDTLQAPRGRAAETC
jgi:hypothetical protein